MTISAAAVVALAAAVLVALPSPGSVSAPARLLSAPGGVPPPVEPAFRPPEPRLLRRGAEAQWAPVRRGVAARASPRLDAEVVGRLPARTPEGTANIALALRTVEDGAGRQWTRVRLSVLPNNSTGWVPRSSLGGYVTVGTRLVVDRSALTATLYRRGRPIFAAPVGVGKPSWPTPVGNFYVRNELAGFDDATYGPVAFGTSARSRVLTDWPAGGFIGIHGTDHPELVPGRISHGCIRMKNEDILELSRLMPVGTPVRIR